MREIIVGKWRGVTSIVALLVLASAAAVAWAWSQSGPTDPATASRAAILRWLATSDVSKESPATQLALVDRLEQELHAGLPLDGLNQASESHQSNIAANAEWLKQHWFISRTQQYHQLPLDERADFLDARIETVFAWTTLDAAFDSSLQSDPANSAAADFFDDIERWIADELNSQRREQMESVVYDGVVHWLATRELADQPHDVRTELASRIAAQLDRGLAAGAAASERASEQQDRLRRNGILLMESWLTDQARQYGQLPTAEHGAFLDEQIDRVSGWEIWDVLAPSETGSATGGAKTGALAQFPQLAQNCINRARPDDKPKLQRLITDVQTRMISRWLERAAGRG